MKMSSKSKARAKKAIACFFVALFILSLTPVPGFATVSSSSTEVNWGWPGKNGNGLSPEFLVDSGARLDFIEYDPRIIILGDQADPKGQYLFWVFADPQAKDRRINLTFRCEAGIEYSVNEISAYKEGKFYGVITPAVWTIGRAGYADGGGWLELSHTEILSAESGRRALPRTDITFRKLINGAPVYSDRAEVFTVRLTRAGNIIEALNGSYMDFALSKKTEWNAVATVRSGSYKIEELYPVHYSVSMIDAASGAKILPVHGFYSLPPDRHVIVEVNSDGTPDPVVSGESVVRVIETSGGKTPSKNYSFAVKLTKTDAPYKDADYIYELNSANAWSAIKSIPIGEYIAIEKAEGEIARVNAPAEGVILTVDKLHMILEVKVPLSDDPGMDTEEGDVYGSAPDGVGVSGDDEDTGEKSYDCVISGHFDNDSNGLCDECGFILKAIVKGVEVFVTDKGIGKSGIDPSKWVTSNQSQKGAGNNNFKSPCGNGWVYIEENNHGTWDLVAEGDIEPGTTLEFYYQYKGDKGSTQIFVALFTINGEGRCEITDFFGTGSGSINAVYYGRVTLPGDLIPPDIGFSPDEPTGSLTIRKNANALNGSGERLFKFDISKIGSDNKSYECDHIAIELDADSLSGAERLINLLYGRYRVEEVTEGDFPYEISMDPADGEVIIDENNTDVTITVTNALKDGGGDVEPPDDDGGDGDVEPPDDDGGDGDVEPPDDDGGDGDVEPPDDDGVDGDVDPPDDDGGDGDAEPPDDDGGDVNIVLPPGTTKMDFPEIDFNASQPGESRSGGVIYNAPPVPTAASSSLMPGRDEVGGVIYFELDDNGVALGEWKWGGDKAKWVFGEYPAPLGALPRTGYYAISLSYGLLSLIAAALSGIAAIVYIEKKKR